MARPVLTDASADAGERVRGPLSGLNVLDFSTLLPGPMATRMLSDEGASVAKIERPGGEDMRRFAPLTGNSSAPWQALNQGKAIIELDLKSPEAMAVILPLVREADILVEQFRPGVMARLGLGHETVAMLNPRLIYCSITGYGQHGPRAMEAGHDINYQARSGLLSQSLDANVRFPLPPALIADIAGGAMRAVTRILLALRARDQSGQGCHLDVAMSAGLSEFMLFQRAEAQVNGAFPVGGTGLLTGGSARYGLYRTSDGRFLAVGALEDKFWKIFCDAIGLDPSHMAQASDQEKAKAAVAAIIIGESGAHWRDLLEPLDCCCTLVATMAEAMAGHRMLD
jgi:alpha-methylacyl-CoA racemase